MCRQKSPDAEMAVPQKRARVEDEDKDGPEVKRIQQDSKNGEALPSKADLSKPGTERHQRREQVEPRGSTAPDKVLDREKVRSRDTAKEDRRAHTSKERYACAPRKHG